MGQGARMMQNIGGFLVLSWLWLNRSKEPEVTVTEREPFVPVVAPGKGWSLDAEEEEPTTREPFVPVVPPIPLTPVCPPTEIRLDLTTADTINYDSRIKTVRIAPRAIARWK